MRRHNNINNYNVWSYNVESLYCYKIDCPLGPPPIPPVSFNVMYNFCIIYIYKVIYICTYISLNCLNQFFSVRTCVHTYELKKFSKHSTEACDCT